MQPLNFKVFWNALIVYKELLIIGLIDNKVLINILSLWNEARRNFLLLAFTYILVSDLQPVKSLTVRIRGDGFLSIEIAYGFCMRLAYTVKSLKYGASMVIPEPSRLGDSRILITRQKW